MGRDEAFGPLSFSEGSSRTRSASLRVIGMRMSKLALLPLEGYQFVDRRLMAASITLVQEGYAVGGRRRLQLKVASRRFREIVATSPADARCVFLLTLIG
jgi:hypothetical protein